MHQHHRPHRTTPRRRAGRLLGLVLAVVVLVPAAASAVPVEPYATYQPQTICSPNAKPGALRLSSWLQKEYPGSGSLGIARSCQDGGVSEHKEGRAFDWAVDVGSARDRGYVAAFMQRIFATDADGNKHALARRMGIMYLIWNDQIYSSYYGFTARPYHGCRVLAGCSATLRHRNHVHISLSRDGGAGKTSWYTGGTTTPPHSTTPPPTTPTTPTPPTAPVPSDVLDLDGQRYASVTVPADGTAKVTSFRLLAGTTYQVTAAGIYGYGAPAQVADASCRWAVASRSWTPYPSRAVMAAHGSLNLRVDGQRISAKTCRRDHVYTRLVTPDRTRTLKLQVANRPAGASGSLRVLVSRPGTDVSAGLPRDPATSAAPALSAARSGTGLVAETVRMPANTAVVRSVGSLRAGADYRLTVSGTAGLGGGVGTDGRCLSVGGRWYPQASLDRRTPGAAHGRLYVAGRSFTGAAASGPTCGTRTHTLVHRAARTGRLELGVWDPLTRADDTGALTVRVQRLTPIATPIATPTAAAAERPAAATPWRQARDTVTVRASAGTGAVSAMRLRTGEVVDLVATGTTRSGSTDADTSCVRTAAGWRPADPAVALGQDPHELWVDGRRVGWRTAGGRSGCSAEHAYRVAFTATKDGPLRLAVLDLDHGDDTGALRVTLTRR
jgi:hypothetical protein